MLAFGMPMGPARLLDEIGFDVAAKVSEVLHAEFQERMTPCPLFPAMVAAGALGAKSGGGLYRSGGKGTKAGPGQKVLAALRKDRNEPLRTAGDEEIVRRLIHPMVDEAYRCLDEGVVAAPEDLDLGLVFGIGFPPFLGGITRYGARESLQAIAHSLDELSRTHSPHFAPSDGLRRRAIEAAGQG